MNKYRFRMSVRSEMCRIRRLVLCEKLDTNLCGQKDFLSEDFAVMDSQVCVMRNAMNSQNRVMRIVVFSLVYHAIVLICYSDLRIVACM
ncbi:hypothetical protein L6452_22065 [Arctium lappa]|uniref:Uncharacterized protein n=1 Tax=Arctium lappa TaxID=4217 RepID=A0ACB9B0G1_ARCLA|nr:hypothetical protein L6452_22065 [Arctium lappa]